MKEGVVPRGWISADAPVTAEAKWLWTQVHLLPFQLPQWFLVWPPRSHSRTRAANTLG